MPRPVFYTKEDMESLINDKLTKGIPVKEGCRNRKWPYVSVNKALRKYGLRIPRTYAEVKATVVHRTTNGALTEPHKGSPVVILAAPKPKKPRKPKVKAPETIQVAKTTV